MIHVVFRQKATAIDFFMRGTVDNGDLASDLTGRTETEVRTSLDRRRAVQFSAVKTRVLFRRWSSALAVSVAMLLCNLQAAQPVHIPKNAIARELIVKFKNGVRDSEIEHGVRLGKLRLKKHLQTELMLARGEEGLVLAETDDAVENAIERLSRHSAIDYVEPNFRYTHQAISNDPYVSGGYLWGMYGDVGSPVNRYGSQASEAWNAGFTGNSNIFVAVLDEGIQINHPELAPNIWTNPFDPVDGVDNDGNGYIDDVNGWNFAANTRQVFDASGDEHGTHVAGTIGARGGNGSGIAGVNWNVKIISGKFLGPDGGSTLDAVEAIDYFIALKNRHGLNLVAINASWGGSGYSRALHEAVIRAAKAGILFIAAAGNDGADNDSTAFYPANLDTRVGTRAVAQAAYNNVISVAAIDRNGALAGFSNYGLTNVHIAAPGVDILSSIPGSQFGYMNGTSMAAPHVTGAVALYASTHPAVSAEAIREALLGAVLPTSSVIGKTVTGGRLNLSSVIEPPIPAPNSITATAGNAVVNLNWSMVNGASYYIVKRSQQSGGAYTTIASAVAGTTYSDTSVVNGTNYYYVVASVNGAGAGENSAPVSATPTAPMTASCQLLGDDDSTSGWWRGVYGSDGGCAYPYGTITPPAFVKIGAYRNFALTWAASTSDSRALQKTVGSDRVAAAWSSPDYLFFYLNFTDGIPHEVSFYFVDYDRQGRDQLLEFYDNVTGRLIGSERIAGFENGRYSTWVLRGNVRLKLSRIAGPNCVLSAMFFDPENTSSPFMGADNTTAGSWKNIYGGEGGLAYPYGNFIPPSYVQISANKNFGLMWETSTLDLRAMQKPTGTDRVAGAWNSSDDFTFYLQFKDSAPHQVTLYFVDYDRVGREQKVEIFDRTTGELLDCRILSSFEDGVYLKYRLSGNVRIKVSRLTGPNSVMSAILFDSLIQ